MVLRAHAASTAMVHGESGATEIEIFAHPSVAAVGYHTRDPAEAQTPAAPWPFDFVAKLEGSTLTLSACGETMFPRRKYVLEKLTLYVPRGVEVRREKQPPTRAIGH